MSGRPDSRRPVTQDRGPRINHQIRIRQVRVIDEENKQLGIMETADALALALHKQLDLVEIAPNQRPPVCRIMDFGKFKYEEKKKESDARKRQVQVELKEVKLRPKTDDHDLEVKAKHIRRFLEDGNKVKVTCRFRGREITHPETAEVQLVHFIETTKDIAIVEQTPRMEAKTMTILLSPKAEIRARVAQQVAKRAEQEKQKAMAAKAGEATDDEDELKDDEE